jgi:hypothetical protein
MSRCVVIRARNHIHLIISINNNNTTTIIIKEKLEERRSKYYLCWNCRLRRSGPDGDRGSTPMQGGRGVTGEQRWAGRRVRARSLTRPIRPDLAAQELVDGRFAIHDPVEGRRWWRRAGIRLTGVRFSPATATRFRPSQAPGRVGRCMNTISRRRGSCIGLIPCGSCADLVRDWPAAVGRAQVGNAETTTWWLGISHGRLFYDISAPSWV